MRPLKSLYLLPLAFCLLPLTVQAQAPTTTTKPIRLIVPYAAGGPIDVSARLLAEQVKDALGTVIVENRPGAGGNLGADLVAKAPADGSVIGIAAVATHAINPWLFVKMPYDAARDFTPITQILRVPNVLVVNADTAKRLNTKTLADFVAYARANPAKLNYGSGGLGSAGHLAGEMFKQAARIYAVHIPYNGGAPAQLALVSGQVDFNFDNLATAAANIKSGKLVALGVTTPTRSPYLPDVPTLSEAAEAAGASKAPSTSKALQPLKGFAVDTWWGLVAPAKLDAAVLAKYNAAFTQALRSDATKTRFVTLFAEPQPTTPEAFAALMASELKKYEPVVKASGATAQ